MKEPRITEEEIEKIAKNLYAKFWGISEGEKPICYLSQREEYEEFVRDILEEVLEDEVPTKKILLKIKDNSVRTEGEEVLVKYSLGILNSNDLELLLNRLGYEVLVI